MPMTVRSGEFVRIYCNATGEQPIEISWHNEDQRPLPRYVFLLVRSFDKSYELAKKTVFLIQTI